MPLSLEEKNTELSVNPKLNLLAEGEKKARGTSYEKVEAGKSPEALAAVLDINTTDATLLIDQMASRGFYLLLKGRPYVSRSFSQTAIFMRQNDNDKYPSIVIIGRPEYDMFGEKNTKKELEYRVKIIDQTAQDSDGEKNLVMGDSLHCFDALKELLDAIADAVDDPKTTNEAEAIFTSGGESHGQEFYRRIHHNPAMIKRIKEVLDAQERERAGTLSPETNVVQEIGAQQKSVVDRLKDWLKSLGKS